MKADDWIPIRASYRDLRDLFRTEAALRYHLARRAVNGLEAADAVRMSPLGHLIVNPARVRAWALAEPTEPRAA
jgi:hypothetical protein